MAKIIKRRVLRKITKGRKVGKFVDGYKYTRYKKSGEPSSGIEAHDRRNNPVKHHFYGSDRLESKKRFPVTGGG